MAQSTMGDILPTEVSMVIEGIVAIRGGWAILSDGWAVFGAPKEEAEANYRAALKRHATIMAREVVGQDNRHANKVANPSHP